MKQFVIAGTLAGALALSGSALAEQAAQPAQPPATPKPAAGAQKPAGDTPATDKPAAPRRATGGDNQAASHVAPKAQPTTAEEPVAPGAMSLGSVRIPKGLKADGKELAAGTYTVRVTADEVYLDDKGSTEKLERWVEFVKGGQVAGREVVSIVPAAETKLVQKDTPPPSGGSKVETLKGGDYTRVWINRAGTYYLVHL